MNTIDRLLKGSIDMHAHYGPDPFAARKVDALKGAQMARDAGMRAIVLKNHQYGTAPLAAIVSEAVSDITVAGSICLNVEAGGLNPDIVEMAAKLGAKIVWMPTQSSNYDYMHNKFRTGGIGILDDTGKLLPSVAKILDIAKHYEMVVATGHLPVNEAFVLVESAVKKGISKIVATHALGWHVDTYFTIEQQRRIADMGAFVEYCFVTTIPEGGLTPKEMVAAIKAVGAHRCILSTDLGQANNPAPVEGMKLMIAAMLDNGLTEKEIEIMVKTNPAKLLGLD
jgi:predicted TIM-barrel fold metal-dependent hydrolase